MESARFVCFFCVSALLRERVAQLFRNGLGHLDAAERADIESQTFGDALSVGRIGFVEVRNLQLLNTLGSLSQVASNNREMEPVHPEAGLDAGRGS